MTPFPWSSRPKQDTLIIPQEMSKKLGEKALKESYLTQGRLHAYKDK